NGHGSRREDRKCGRRVCTRRADAEEDWKRTEEGGSEYERRGPHSHICGQHRGMEEGRQGSWRILQGYSTSHVDGAGERVDLAGDSGGNRSGCGDRRMISMTKCSGLVMTCFVFWSCAVVAQSGAGVTVIRAGTLIDGKSDKPRANQVIVIRGNRIESVSDASSAKIPAGASEMDLSKETVLPGLIDSHT